MKRMKPNVQVLMSSGVSHIPESARIHIDAFLEKGVQPITVLSKIDELLTEPLKPAA